MRTHDHTPRTGPVRRAVLAGGLAAPFVARPAAAEADFKWRAAHSAPVDFPLHVRLSEAAAAIREKSGGRVEIGVFPNGELGSPVGLLAQVRSGAIDMTPLSHQVLSADLAAAVLPTAGFAFTGEDVLWPAMDGEIGTYLRKQFRERLGLVAASRCWDFGFRQVTTSGKRIRGAADIAGFRLRVPPEPEFVELFQALKALPVGMPLSGLEAAMRAGGVDGQEGLLPLVVVAGLDSFQRTCALTHHIWDGHWMCVGAKSWARLPPKLQEVVAAELDSAGLLQRADIQAETIRMRRQLEDGGMAFNTVDPASFRAVLRSAGYYEKWRTRAGKEGWELLEKAVGRLA